MNEFQFKIKIAGKDQADAEAQMRALMTLVQALDTKTLVALADKGPGMLKHPMYGGIIKKQLGI